MVILITGASGGIGEETALALVKKGHRVYGTYRSKEPECPCYNALYMDVNDEASIDKAVAEIIKREGRLDALINNAGMGVAGPVELTSSKEALSQMATNYLGALSVTRAALPHLRESGGKVICVSSLAARIPIPFQSMYSASKAALEITMQALSAEAKPFRVKTCCVELGDTKTGFTQSRKAARATAGDTIYGERFKRSIAKMEHDEIHGASPKKAAKCIARQTAKKNPPPVVCCGAFAKLVYGMKKVLPVRLANYITGGMYAK